MPIPMLSTCFTSKSSLLVDATCLWFSLLVQIAKRQAVVNPENTFFSVKRFIGRKIAEVKEESTQVPYKVSLVCTILERSGCQTCS